jgi:hypothetical protein
LYIRERKFSRGNKFDNNRKVLLNPLTTHLIQDVEDPFVSTDFPSVPENSSSEPLTNAALENSYTSNPRGDDKCLNNRLNDTNNFFDKKILRIDTNEKFAHHEILPAPLAPKHESSRSFIGFGRRNTTIEMNANTSSSENFAFCDSDDDDFDDVNDCTLTHAGKDAFYQQYHLTEKVIDDIQEEFKNETYDSYDSTSEKYSNHSAKEYSSKSTDVSEEQKFNKLRNESKDAVENDVTIFHPNDIHSNRNISLASELLTHHIYHRDDATYYIYITMRVLNTVAITCACAETAFYLHYSFSHDHQLKSYYQRIVSLLFSISVIVIGAYFIYKDLFHQIALDIEMISAHYRYG